MIMIYQVCLPATANDWVSLKMDSKRHSFISWESQRYRQPRAQWDSGFMPPQGLATRPVYASLQCIRFDHHIVILSSSILTSNTGLRSRNTGVQSYHTCSFMSPHVTDPRSWVLLKKQDWLWQEMGELDLEQAPATSLRATNTCCIWTINH